LPFIANVPLPAVKEVLAAGVPSNLLMDTGSVTFLYDDGRWIKAQLFETSWPDLSHILNVESAQTPIPPDLFEGLKAVKDFSDKDDRRVWFRNGCIAATPEAIEDGAEYTVEGIHHEGIYRAEMLALLQGVATTADFSRYPEPVVFYGDRMRGALLGLRT
jgi:hypothetical protein